MTIKEEIKKLNDDYLLYKNSVYADSTIISEAIEAMKSGEIPYGPLPDDPEAMSKISSYCNNIVVPEIIRLSIECEAIGHVNLETITRDDEERTRYYLCDECGKQIELGPTPQ